MHNSTSSMSRNRFTQALLAAMALFCAPLAIASAHPTDGVICGSQALLNTVSASESAQGLLVIEDRLYSMSLAGSIQVYNLYYPDLPFLNGEFSYETEGLFLDFAVKDDYVYIVDNSEGIHIVDFSNIFSPQLVTTYREGSISKFVEIEDELMYVIDVGDDLQIVDISDPEDPQLISEFDLASMKGFDIQDGIAYIANYHGGLRSYDVRDPLNLVYLDYVDGPQDPWDLTVEGQFAYIANGREGVAAYDISDPSNMVLVSNLGNSGDDNEGELGFVYHVSVSGNYVYASGLSNGFNILDYTDPANPIRLSNHAALNGADSSIVIDNLAYVSGWNDTLSVYDVSNPTLFPVITRFDPLGSNRKVSIYGDTAFLATGGWGVQSFDISNPATPIQTGSFFTPNEAEQVVVRDGYAYIADGRQYFEIYDITDLDNPEHVSSVEVIGYCKRVSIDGNYAYIAGTAGLNVVDIRDPHHPVWMAFFDTDSELTSVQAIDDTVFATTFRDGFFIFRLTHEAQPYVVGSTPLSALATGLAIMGDKALISGWYSGLHVIDIQDLSSPTVMASFPVDDDITSRDMHVVGDRAFVAQHSHGLGVYDISDLTDISEIGRFRSHHYGLYVSATSEIAFLSDDYGSVYILDVTESCGACPADLNDDRVLNFFDVTIFIEGFATQSDDADFNGDGLLNFFDVSSFLETYLAGCP